MLDDLYDSYTVADLKEMGFTVYISVPGVGLMHYTSGMRAHMMILIRLYCHDPNAISTNIKCTVQPTLYVLLRLLITPSITLSRVHPPFGWRRSRRRRRPAKEGKEDGISSSCGTGLRAPLGSET